MWRLLRWLIVVEALMLVSTEMAAGMARLASHEILAPYQALMPGQPIQAVEAFCQLQVGTSAQGEVGLCQFEANDGIFGLVTVVEHEQVIRYLSFEVLPDALHIGDLVACWGEPTRINLTPAIVDGKPPMVGWGDVVFAAPEIYGNAGALPRYFLKVNALSLANAPPPCKAGR